MVSSPLIRTLETATPIADSLQLSTVVWSDLREGFSHYHQGRSLAELQDRFPNAQFPEEINEQGWHHGDDIYVDWKSRCERVLNQLSLFSDDSCIALINHGGFGNYLLHSALGLSFERPYWFELANCSISRLRFVPNPEAERPNWPLSTCKSRSSCDQ